MTEEDGVFFYAGEDAESYDELTTLTDPEYTELHSTLNQQLSLWLLKRNSQKVLDLGCGTGLEAMPLLTSFDALSVVGIDVSESMLNEFRAKLSALPNLEKRCQLIQSDLRSERLAETNFSASTAFSAAISVYVLHHFDIQTKRKIYMQIYEMLEPGGAFINADLFTYSTSHLADWAQQRLETWITEQFNAASENTGTGSNRSLEDWARLRNYWLHHVREENQPTVPLRTTARGVQGPNEQDLLEECGFIQVECSYRKGQAAILWAMKG